MRTPPRGSTVGVFRPLAATEPHRHMTRLILLAFLGFLVLPGAALAAPAKISPRASAVSAAGVATIEVANPNRYRLRGTATVTVRGRTVAQRTVRLPQRSGTTVKLPFSPHAVAALPPALSPPPPHRRGGGHDRAAPPPPGRPPLPRWTDAHPARHARPWPGVR